MVHGHDLEGSAVDFGDKEQDKGQVDIVVIVIVIVVIIVVVVVVRERTSSPWKAHRWPTPQWPVRQ